MPHSANETAAMAHTEYAVVRNGAIVSLGPAVNAAGAKAYAAQQGLELMCRQVGEWTKVKK